jgi:hypothetical protein
MGATPKQQGGGLTLEELKKKQALPIKKQGFTERVSEDLSKRRENVSLGIEAQSKGEQTAVETGFQAVGQGVGLVFDVAGEALKSVVNKIPQAVKKPIEQVSESILSSPLGQAGLRAISQGVDSYNEWKKGNPRTARDLEAIVNIAMLAPVGGGAKVGSKVGEAVGKPVLESTGTALKASGETALKSERQGFIRNLLRESQTKAVKEAQVARTSETGIGIGKKSIIAPSKSEALAEKYVIDIPEVSSKNTLQGNYNIIKDANISEAKKLSSELAENDFIYPRQELLSRLNNAKGELAKNPVITGDAEKTAEKLVAEFQRRIEETPAKGSNLLQVRKEFDAWVESQKGGKAFDPVRENAFSIANREIRQTVNSFLDEKAPTVGVKESLRKQSALFTALDNLKPKAAYEADTAIKRFIQRAEVVLGTKNRAVQILAATVGIGGLGAAATFAPAAAGIGIGGYFIYRGGKLVLSPKIRKALGEVVVKLGDKKGGSVFGGSIGASGVIELKSEIQKFLDEYDD